MKKNVFIFNCCGTLDLHFVPKLYNVVEQITRNKCNKYCCVFSMPNNSTMNTKFWSRSGAIKHMDQNIQKYTTLAKSAVSRLDKVEMYNLQKENQSWGLNQTSCGLYIDRLTDNLFNVYVVSSTELTSKQILDLWSAFSKSYKTNYMVSFSLDSDKCVEIYMLGMPIYPALADPKTYYSNDEKEVIDKLKELRYGLTCDLGSCFSSCIVTEKFKVDEQSYASKTIVDNDSCWFSK